MLQLPCLYPITDRALAGGRSHAELVDLLCGGGATLIQMREKALPDRDLLREARAAAAAARVRGARLVVNDRADVAVLAGAGGVHVGGEDLPPRAARAVVGPDAILGVSAHSVEEAVTLSGEPVDYVALGPIFPTRNASRSRPPLGLAAIERAAAAVARPLVVIGGFDPQRARQALAAGATSVAVLGDLMTAADIPGRTAVYVALGAA